jgi:hypothetical protein
MYCPKCGIENPETGTYCRKCGTDLSGVSKALENKDDGEPDYLNVVDHMDPTGISRSARRRDRSRHGQNVDPDALWGGGIRNTIFGFGFLVVALALLLTNVAGGHSWWWAMLFPAFSLIAGGIGNLSRAKRLEKRMNGSLSSVENNRLPNKDQVASLPPNQTEYVSPDSSSYNTGDLVPSSVVENTTKLLELDSEGKTMTLPKK